ncbi:SusD/RagB family nutrient-binding outer membrane lipoprotein [uncultured Bacteroides sp.]|uniref:SusD/RagB family nutrient-binding outer membrane lipoprotein n=1 Tax=uncultured Bacteroides sp. TaxID=162156 RepID=UPI00280BC8FC|nr:SusD/RagB family nutrient-binding outer membrane lipoprotein [uncultured Bacteroides sp.]
MNKIIRNIGAGVAMCLMIVGCTTNFEEFNTNPYQPAKVPANSLLSTMFKVYASPQQNDCQAINCMWACFSGQITAPYDWGKGKNLFAYYSAMEDHNRASWGTIYGQIYPNFFRIEEATEKKGVIYAMAQLTRIYAMQLMASLQGPIPYSKVTSGDIKSLYDDEPTAWRAMFDDLDNVITILKSAAELGINQDLATVDQFYGGDCAKWMKFANTLKLRMAIRVSGVADYAQSKAEEAVLGGVLESTSESAYDTTHSGIGVNGYSIVSGWGELKANACIISYMNGYKDPRRSAYFTKQTAGLSEEYVGVRSGSNEIPVSSTYANYSNLIITTNRSLPQPVMYAAEAAFLRAEGKLKGWDMKGEAKDFYEQGVRLSFAEFNVSGVDEYLSDNTSVPGDYTDGLHASDNYPNQSSITIQWNEGASDAEKLERVLTQKWIACYPDPMNGWADYRRTGYPKIFPATSSADGDCTVERGQRRIRFADTEYNTNKENVEAAVSMLNGGKDSNGTDLWWALKSNGSY